jgi:hypothetical protein
MKLVGTKTAAAAIASVFPMGFYAKQGLDVNVMRAAV